MSAQLVDLIRLTGTAMSHATAALFSTDAPAAERLASAYEAVSALRHGVEDHAAALLALRGQSRVLELPATIAAVHINAEAEHMGQLAREVADIARTRRVWASIPDPLLGTLRELSEVSLDTAAKAATVVESHTTIGVAELARNDDNVNRLRHLLYQQLLSNRGVIDVDAAIDLTLVARCYERYADDAVAVANCGALLGVGAPSG
jgi:phosphate transport system protein